MIGHTVKKSSRKTLGSVQLTSIKNHKNHSCWFTSKNRPQASKKVMNESESHWDLLRFCYRKWQRLVSVSHFDVKSLDFIGTGKDTSTGNTTKDIGTGTFHHWHESFRFKDLHTAVDWGFVVNTWNKSYHFAARISYGVLTSTRGHHHSTSDGINWVGSKTRDNSNTPSKNEWSHEGTIFTNEDWLESIVDTEVKTSVDEDTDTRDSETSVETGNTVGGDSLLVDIDETVVLSLTVLA